MHMHFPLHVTFIAIGAVMYSIFEFAEKETDGVYAPLPDAFRWVFAMGCCLVLIFMTMITMLHQAPPTVSRRIDYKIHFAARIIVALALAFVAGFGGGLNTMALMGTVCALVFPLVLFEEHGRMHQAAAAVGNADDDDKECSKL